VDLQKLIESQSKPAQRRLAPDDAVAGNESLNRPVELQQAQADRLKERIEGLERSKAALVESIDIELKELNAELEARTRGIQVERKRLEGPAKAAAEATGGKGKKAADDLAGPAESDPKEKKTPRKAGEKDTEPS
jgi:hypothetical protein